MVSAHMTAADARARIGAVVLTLATVVVLGLRAAPGDGTLGVAGRSNANVTLAAAGSFVAVAWSAAAPDGPTDIYAAVSRDAGTTFSAPSRVNSTAGEANVNGEQPPRIVLLPRSTGAPSLVVVWTAKGPAGTRLLSARSEDAGRTFSPSAGVAGTDAPGNRGWESAAADARGRILTLWLDHRAHAKAPAPTGAQATPHAGHDHAADKKDGVAMAQLSQLYLATLGDAGSPRALTPGVCYCCKTAIATAGDDIYAAWRHVYPGNLRDIAFTVSRDGGRTFAPPLRVSEDKWALDGCPDDGPAMAIDSKNRIHIVWPTLVTDAKGTPSIGLFYARSDDGRSFTPREPIPTEGVAHHPQIAIDARGRVSLAWDELAGGSRRAVFARAVEQQGRPRIERYPSDEPAPGIYPALTSTTRGMLAAWTTGTGTESRIQLRRIE
jgi:hypothetical protein